MYNLDEILTPSQLNQDIYNNLVDYFKNNLETENVEKESEKSTRFDFKNETSIWLNGNTIEGVLYSNIKKKVLKVIKNAPIEINTYIRFEVKK